MILKHILASSQRVLGPVASSHLPFTRVYSSTSVFGAPSAATTRSSESKAANKTQAEPKEKASPKEPAGKHHKLKKADQPPKRSISGFCLFVADKGQRGTQVHERAKALAEEWRALSQEEVEFYRAKAKEERDKRLEAYAKWRNLVNLESLRAINVKRKAVGKPKIRRRRVLGVPKVPPNAYARFLLEYRAEHPEMSYRDVIVRMAPVWRSLPEDRKKPYRDASAADMKVWIEKYAAAKAQNGSV
ncbi:hypothetical protein D9756_007222 [Leucocoprinus leucothites]|uniref:HMG box domain-containing protein n=1 Tax=Leucocoprinus leucothites TaxID=201217 RepID=A0A8H5D6X4_9AGAR|nr:hypothetical protein D9756_007222 [Leucoagaricus leucothites]